MTILIKNGRVINPATGTDETLDVLVENGVVARTGKSIKEKCDRVIDAKGCFVMPLSEEERNSIRRDMAVKHIKNNIAFYKSLGLSSAELISIIKQEY